MRRTLPAVAVATWRPTSWVLRPTRSGRRERQHRGASPRRLAAGSARAARPASPRDPGSCARRSAVAQRAVLVRVRLLTRLVPGGRPYQAARGRTPARVHCLEVVPTVRAVDHEPGAVLVEGEIRRRLRTEHRPALAGTTPLAPRTARRGDTAFFAPVIQTQMEPSGAGWTLIWNAPGLKGQPGASSIGANCNDLRGAMTGRWSPRC